MNTKRHILLVDENPYVVEILVETLSSDFRVTVAQTGQEAARLLIQGYRFDSILSELDLPHFSGLELIKLVRINRLSSQTPIVILSHLSESKTRIECLEQGADAFLSKPFNPLEVKAKLYALLRRTEVSNQDVLAELPNPLKKPSKTLWAQGSRVLSSLFGDFAVS